MVVRHGFNVFLAHIRRKLLVIFAFIFFTLLAFTVLSENGSNRIYDELQLLRLNYSILRNVCGESETKADLPIIFAITPTYARPVQKAELTRLSHTFRLVPMLHWIVVEDANKSSTLVEKLLKKSGIIHTVLTFPTPKEWKVPKGTPWVKPRGVLQRNHALSWIREHVTPKDKAVVYFADDDNVYSLEVFEEMRWTQKVSVWPVGLVGGLLVERPIVNTKTNKVVGWNAAWRPQRPFPIDMAGFAVNVSHLLHLPNAKFSLNAKQGYQESHFLETLTTLEELEPKADGCTKVYVWHTRTESPKLKEEQLRKKKPENMMIIKNDAGIEV